MQSGHAFAKKRAAKFNFGKMKLNLDNAHSRKILEMGKKQGQAQGAFGNGVKALQCRLKRLRRLGQIGELRIIRRAFLCRFQKTAARMNGRKTFFESYFIQGIGEKVFQTPIRKSNQSAPIHFKLHNSPFQTPLSNIKSRVGQTVQIPKILQPSPMRLRCPQPQARNRARRQITSPNCAARLF